MSFQLIKLAGGLLMPVPIVLALLVLGLTLLFSTRMRYLGMGALVLGTGLLLIISVPPLPERALAALEGQYPVLAEPPDAGWIVVLGGGARDEESWPAATRLSESSLYRLAEGVRVARLLPEAKLVTSGGASRVGETTASLMARVAEQWGIESERIVVQAEPENTAAEARAMAARIEPNERVILVTSAFHMTRAVALFEGEGVAVIPAPAGHLAEPTPRYEHAGEFLPRSKHVEFTERLWWERLGTAWATLTGKVD